MLKAFLFFICFIIFTLYLILVIEIGVAAGIKLAMRHMRDKENESNKQMEQ